MTRISKTPVSKIPLTHDAVVDVAGTLGDAMIARILAVGATMEDLEEAVAWAAGESDIMGEERLPLAGNAARLYDILTADEDYADERD